MNFEAEMKNKVREKVILASYFFNAFSCFKGISDGRFNVDTNRLQKRGSFNNLSQI